MWSMSGGCIMICSWITCSWACSDSEDSSDFDIEADIEAGLYIRNAEIDKSLKSDW